MRHVLGRLFVSLIRTTIFINKFPDESHIYTLNVDIAVIHYHRLHKLPQKIRS